VEEVRLGHPPSVIAGKSAEAGTGAESERRRGGEAGAVGGALELDCARRELATDLVDAVGRAVVEPVLEGIGLDRFR